LIIFDEWTEKSFCPLNGQTAGKEWIRRNGGFMATFLAFGTGVRGQNPILKKDGVTLI